MLLLLVTCGVAGPNEPAELQPLPQDSLSEQLDEDVRSTMDQARKLYLTSDETKREAAIALFAKILHPLADRDLIRIAEYDGWPTVRLKATEALLLRENREGPMLAAKLTVCGVPPSIRRAGADLVRRTANAEAEEWLVLVLQHGSLRHMGPKGLGFDRSYNDLADLLYQTMAATALGRVGSPLAVKALISAIPSKSWELRAAAAAALGEAAAVEAAPLLARLLRDEDVDVAIEAALALGRIGGAEATKALEGAAKDTRPLVAKMAGRALRHAKAQAALKKPPPPPPNPGAVGRGTTAEPREPSRPLPAPDVPSPEGSADMLFVIDATFSMYVEFPAVHSQVYREIVQRSDDGDVRVGFVLFRDFDNQWLTRQHFITWDVDKAWEWFRHEIASGANAFEGSASDKALTASAMLNHRPGHRPWLQVWADAPPNDLDVALHRARLFKVFEGGRTDGIYVDRDRETRGFMEKLAGAGGGVARAFRSGASPVTQREKER
jgi:hypothetical protein